MSAEEATPTGVYYHVKDSVGVTRRLLIDLIDVPVAVTLSALVVVPAWTVLPGVDEHPGVALLIRQAIRDKFAGTYVVRLHATPAGSAPIRVRTYMFLGDDVSVQRGEGRSALTEERHDGSMVL